jgi:hypothetical protein
LDELSADDFSALPFDQEWLFGMSLLAETAALVGHTDSAPILYRLLLPWAALNVVDQAEGIRGSLSRHLGMPAASLHRWTDAEQHCDRALAMNTSMGARPWLARTQHDYARMLLTRCASGDRRRAGELLDQVRSTYRELGMKSYEASVAATLPAR